MPSVDIFNPANFMKAGLAQQLLEAPKANVGASGVVTWGQCADAEGKFTFDEASSSYSPSPLVKGKNVNLDLEGLVSSPLDLSKVHVNAKWNGASLYDQDITVGKHYDDLLEFDFSWFVPSYAPSGKYDITLTGYDQDKTTTDMCVQASFSF